MIPACNLSRSTTDIFHVKTTPNLPVRTAVRPVPPPARLVQTVAASVRNWQTMSAMPRDLHDAPVHGHFQVASACTLPSPSRNLRKPCLERCSAAALRACHLYGSRCHTRVPCPTAAATCHFHADVCFEDDSFHVRPPHSPNVAGACVDGDPNLSLTGPHPPYRFCAEGRRREAAAARIKLVVSDWKSAHEGAARPRRARRAAALTIPSELTYPEPPHHPCPT